MAKKLELEIADAPIAVKTPFDVAEKIHRAALSRLAETDAKKSTTQPTKNKAPVPSLCEAVDAVESPDPESDRAAICDLADRAHEAIGEEHEAKAQKEAATAPLVAIAKGFYRLIGLAPSGHAKSINVPGTRTSGVRVTFKDSFKSCGIDAHEAVKKAFADAGLDPADHVEETRSISVKQEFSGDDQISKLIDALGEDVFFKVFDVNVAFKLKKDSDRDYHFFTDEIRELFPQSEPSVALR